jgi:hypothetical protein
MYSQSALKDHIPVEYLNLLKISFYKFKVIRMIYPKAGKDIIWIIKHLMTLEGQKYFDQFRELYLEIGPQSIRIMELIRPDMSHLVSRLGDYFLNTPMDFWVTKNYFPPISFSKDRMYLCDVPVVPHDSKIFKEKVTSYLGSLNIKELFVPPQDILYKVGSQLYNNRGTPTKDYINGAYNSPFLLQEFLAQPLQPRQVWLPGKKVKQSNIFWMMIGRQILKHEPAYPTLDYDGIAERLFKNPGLCRFDISGFGLQFDRSLLKETVEVIEELYPCSFMSEKAKEFYDIMDDVTVVFPDGTQKRPVRGIGLGYYEDLKTIVMMAILQQWQPVSLYGDQGLLRSGLEWEALSELIFTYGFQIKDEKVVATSTTDTLDWGMKWGGATFRKGVKKPLFVPTGAISHIIGALFQSYHWRRKLSLHSFAKDHKDWYIRNFETVKNIYRTLFGYEFYPEELDESFIDIGIGLHNHVTMGRSRAFGLSRKHAPYVDNMFDVTYVTPFKKLESKKYPHSVAKRFQRERERIYKESYPIDSSVAFYAKPRVEAIGVYTAGDRVLPRWADILSAVHYGICSEGLTYGLSDELMRKAIKDLNHVADPLRAMASGGLKILDAYHHRSIPSGEWIETVEQFINLKKRYMPYIQRVDLPLDPYWGSDPLYFDRDILRERDHARKRLKTLDYERFEEPSEEALKEIKNKILTSLASRGVLQTAADVFTFKVPEEYTDDDIFPIQDDIGSDADEYADLANEFLNLDSENQVFDF